MTPKTPASWLLPLLCCVALACSHSGESQPGAGGSSAGASVSNAGAPPTGNGGAGSSVAGAGVDGGALGVAGGSSAGLAGASSGVAGDASGGASGSSAGTAGSSAGTAGSSAGTAGSSVGASGSGGASGSTLSSGCGKAFTRPNPATSKSITVGGANRSYQFFVPESYTASKSYPLVITFHGGGGSAASSRAEMHLESATSPGLVVYLNYVNNGWSYADGSPDIAYYQAVREQVEGAFCVDLNRVLVTGFSLGAIQTNGIGCTLGGKSVRAIVPIDGSGPYPQPAPPSEAVLSCPAGTPVGDPAVMVIHGSNDTTALYKYGQWTTNYWRKHNGCMDTPSNLSAPFQGCISYAGCRASVNFCTHSGNHEVPSSAGGWVWAFLATLP